MKRQWFFILLFGAIFLLCRTGAVAAEPAVILQPSVAWQGKVVSVRLPSLEGAVLVQGLFLDRQFKCYPQGDDYLGVFGIPINQKPGSYNLQLFVTGSDGSRQVLNRPIKVWATRWPVTRFWLPPARDKLRARQIVDNEWARVQRVLLVANEERLWEGRFSRPASGEVSMGFGHREIINNKPAGNHRGVDFAVPIGTAIRAPNHGKVVFAEQLRAFGGTMVLDHGQGVHTLYFHLSRFIAPVGETVRRGQTVALSGNSGISSGPHLHWGMSVNDLRVDPMQWTRYEL